METLVITSGEQGLKNTSNDEDGHQNSIFNFCCAPCKKLQNSWTRLQNYFGGATKFRLKLSLIAFPIDFVIDCLTSMSHVVRGNYLEGILTYLIVFISGFLISVGFLAGSDRSFLINEAKSAGKFWPVLLVFPPGLLPFVIAKIRLNCENEASKTEESGIVMAEKLLLLKDMNLKANWAEAVLEGKYQSLLQLIIILEDGTLFESFFDYMPVFLTIWATVSHTLGIYNLVSEQYLERNAVENVKAVSNPTWSKLYGYSYTAVSILCPALCVNGARSLFASKEGETFEKLVASFAAFFIYYCSFGIVYIVSLILANKCGRENSFSYVFHSLVLIVHAGSLKYWISTTNCCSLSSSCGPSPDLKCISISTISIFLALSSFFLSFIARDFAQFGLSIMNDKINKNWTDLQTRVQTML